jgi:hypothetical protein
VNEKRRKVQPYVDLAELFAMPLTALIDADADAAESFTEFLRTYGSSRRRGRTSASCGW